MPLIFEKKTPSQKHLCGGVSHHTQSSSFPIPDTTAQKNILLHTCCGPCSIMPIQRLQEHGFQVTAYFMNPNIHPLAEYLRRREGMQECASRLNIAVIWDDASWDLHHWLASVAGKHDRVPKRCTFCYRQRLNATARTASTLGFSCFTSSLLYSRYQNHEDICQSAKTFAQSEQVDFFYQDFRVDWQAGIDISKAWNIYRQPYCGCIYSEAERYAKQLYKLIPSEKA